MTRLLAAALAATALAALGADPGHAPPAFRLGDSASPLSYEARLAVDPRREEFTGEIRIGLHVNAATRILWMNARGLTIDDAHFEQRGERIEVRVVDGGEHFAGFEAKERGFERGPAVAFIRYRGMLDANTPQGLFRQREGGEWYAFSQFEAFDARRAFPCFDEPGWKTPWRLTVDAPVGDVVVSNTLAKEAPAPGKAGWTRHAFAWTRPLPTYLVALAVGPFDVVDGGKAGRNKVPLRYIAPHGRGAEARFAARSTPRMLEMLEGYFGIPYPYEKLDSVAVPQFGGEAMENAGMITYDATLLLARPADETDVQKMLYVSVGSHEISHQWFGDYVTLAWWDDTWLNEAFATWMAEKIVNRYEPAWDNGYNHSWYRRRAVAADRLASARRIRNPVTGYDDIDAAFDPITYDKGGEVLAMFEAWITPERFRKGVRAYLRHHAWGSATSGDFFKALAESSGRPEAVKAFTQFVEQPGMPLEDVALACDARGASLEVTQRRFKPVGSQAPDAQWITPVCFRYPVEGRLETQCIEAGAVPLKTALAKAKGCPAWVVGNAGGTGHYVVRYDEKLAERDAGSLREVPGREAVALVGDATVLAESGTIPMDEGLAWGEAALLHPSPVVKLVGVQLAKALRDPWLSDAGRRRKHALVAERIVPLARSLGWSHREGDDADTRALRSVALPIAAEFEEGAGLRGEARELALRWSADRSSVAADMVRPVLDTAGRFADEPTFAKLEAALKAIAEARDRKAVAQGLARARDAGLRERAFALAIAKGEGSLTSIMSLDLLWSAASDDGNRRAVLDFVAANYGAVERKVPDNSLARVIAGMEGLCARADRDAFVAAFAERSPGIVGGTVAYRQSLESIDLCLAARGL